LLGLPHAAYDVQASATEPGDLVVFYTDGVTEARSPDGQQLGEEFIHHLINLRQSGTTATIADACVDAAVEHAQSRLKDDVLVIAARCGGDGDDPIAQVVVTHRPVGDGGDDDDDT
jgi:phosphoserine phosphatase RsbU/P